MELAPEQKTLYFLEAIWLNWCTDVLNEIGKEYCLDQERLDILKGLLASGNDISIQIAPPLTGKKIDNSEM